MILVVLLVLILLVSTFNTTVKICKKTDKDDMIKTLVRQAARWATAAKQDKNSMVAVLHANYAAGYLWAVSDIASSDEISYVSGVDYFKIKDEITSIQDNITRNMAGLCPDFAPDSSFLASIAGESA
jgi:hypothetical protein